MVNLQLSNIEALLHTFKEGYYCEEDAVKEAIRYRGMFNIIDHASGFKADFIILKHEPFRKAEFERRREVDFFDTPVFVVSAEDLLLSKLIWIQQLQSVVQMDDIKNLALIKAMDWRYIHTWLSLLKLNTFDLIKHD